MKLSILLAALVAVAGAKALTNEGDHHDAHTSSEHKPKPFHIGVWDPFKAHHKEPSSYISFSGDDAVLVHNKHKAANFTLIHGDLTSNHSHVGVTKENGSPLLQKGKSEQLETHNWNRTASGSVAFVGKNFTFGDGKAVFCATSDGSIFAQLTKSTGHGCKEIIIRDAQAYAAEFDKEHQHSASGSPPVPQTQPANQPTTLKTSKTHPAPHTATKPPHSHTTKPPHSHTTKPPHSHTTKPPHSHPAKPPHGGGGHSHPSKSPSSSCADPSGDSCGDSPSATAAPDSNLRRRLHGLGGAANQPRRRGLLVAKGKEQ